MSARAGRRRAGTVARAQLFAVAVVAALVAAGCPAPPLDDNEYPYDIGPWDAVPADPPLRNPSGAPSCSPEGVVDANAVGQRAGNVLRVRVDTRGRRNDVRVGCAPYDSSEVVLRYTTPAFAERDVRALRVTTITEPTLPVRAGLDGGLPVEDAGAPAGSTEYDTVLAIRLTCEGREVACNNDAFVRDPETGATLRSRRSEVYHVEPGHEETMYIVVDGFDRSAGAAVVTIEEITELGVLGAPCEPVPAERGREPGVRTAFFRCPHDGIVCGPAAAPDGTDLCLPIVPLGGECDRLGHFNVCARSAEGVECATNPAAADPSRCALPGTAPGTACRGLRGSANRCDGPDLLCSEGGPMATRDECVVVRRLGGACDPTPFGAIDRCEIGLSCCLPSPDAGSAVCVTAESAARMCYRPPQ